MSQSKSNVKIGRPSLGRTRKQLKEYLKLRSREYYASPQAKEKQRPKSRDRLEKNLKRIWSIRGLI